MRDADVAVESFSKTLQMMKRSQPARKSITRIRKTASTATLCLSAGKAPGVFQLRKSRKFKASNPETTGPESGSDWRRKENRQIAFSRACRKAKSYSFYELDERQCHLLKRPQGLVIGSFSTSEFTHR
jgi:hypothetical protein